MAVETNATGENLVSASQPITAYPFTLLAYVNVANTNVASAQWISSLRQAATRYCVLEVIAITGSSFIQIRADNNTGSRTAVAPLSLSANVWYPAAMVCASDTSRTAYVWDGLGGTRYSQLDSGSKPFDGYPGAVWTAHNGGTSQLRVQDLAILDVALNTTQLDAWAAGRTAISCSFAGDLVLYQPLVAAVNEAGYIGPTFSATGSPSWVSGPPLVSGSVIPLLLDQRRKRD